MFSNKITVASSIFYLVFEKVGFKYFALKHTESQEKYLCNKKLEKPGTKRYKK